MTTVMPLYFDLKLLIIPASKGWMWDVVLGGKKQTVTFDKLKAWKSAYDDWLDSALWVSLTLETTWDGALSTRRRTWRFCILNPSLKCESHDSQMSRRIHAFELYLYVTGILDKSIPLKHWVFFVWPMINGFILWLPVLFVASSTVIRDLSCVFENLER